MYFWKPANSSELLSGCKIIVLTSCLHRAYDIMLSANVLQSELDNSIGSSKTLGELHSKLHASTEKLLSLNMFEVVDSQIQLGSLSEGKISILQVAISY